VLILACKVRMKTHSTDKFLAFWEGEQGDCKRRTDDKNLDIFTLISNTIIKMFTA